MKRLLLLILLASMSAFADDTPFDWSGLERSKISLEAPLLIVRCKCVGDAFVYTALSTLPV